ncbi:MAG TPA: serine O-acetyltransferase [Jatrophihabitantaceae bacterium]|nr:serine O-acetyltransferase [Jatrophihabitantaceae bacterium]
MTAVEHRASAQPALSFIETVRDDLAAAIFPSAVSRPELRTTKFWLVVLAKVLVNPRMRAVLYFRIGHELHQRRLALVALWLRARSLRIAGAEIHPAATIGPGFVLVHSSGVVIGAGVTIGSGCRVHQGVTLGEPGKPRAKIWLSPTIGNDVVLGAHAVILGGITIGDRVLVGANAVVTSDVGPDMVAVGVPARATPRH